MMRALSSNRTAGDVKEPGRPVLSQATAAQDPRSTGWTLHQLRHSALQHLAIDGRGCLGGSGGPPMTAPTRLWERGPACVSRATTASGRLSRLAGEA